MNNRENLESLSHQYKCDKFSDVSPSKHISIYLILLVYFHGIPKFRDRIVQALRYDWGHQMKTFIATKHLKEGKTL